MTSDHKCLRTTILFFDVTDYSETSKFFICCSGVFLFFIGYGYFQELIFQLEGFRPYGMYLTLIQFICYSIFGYLERQLSHDIVRRIPLRMLLILSVLTVATMGLSNTSVGYLNYPTQVVFKCCKLIPVLLGGILIQGKRYTPLDFLAAGLMSLGLALFILTDVEVAPNFNLTGVVLISLALVADALIGNIQEKTMRKYSASTVEVVYYSYLIGCVFILSFLVAFKQLGPAFLFCAEYPVETYGYGCVFSVMGYCGVQLVLSLVQMFGAFVAVTVTTFRKALTLCLSFLLFTKPFSIRYVWSSLIVIAGIYLNLLSKEDNRKRMTQVLRRLLGKMKRKHSIGYGSVVSSV